jgi:hypothetical protein
MPSTKSVRSSPITTKFRRSARGGKTAITRRPLSTRLMPPRRCFLCLARICLTVPDCPRHARMIEYSRLSKTCPHIKSHRSIALYSWWAAEVMRWTRAEPVHTILKGAACPAFAFGVPDAFLASGNRGPSCEEWRVNWRHHSIARQSPMPMVSRWERAAVFRRPRPRRARTVRAEAARPVFRARCGLGT